MSTVSTVTVSLTFRELLEREGTLKLPHSEKSVAFQLFAKVFLDVEELSDLFAGVVELFPGAVVLLWLVFGLLLNASNHGDEL